MEAVFVASIAFLAYTWIIFPVLLAILSLVTSRRKGPLDHRSPSHLPSISVVIAAFNEQDKIGQRIENLLGQDYPLEKLEIIVASDGSTDRTVEIASRYRGVQVLAFERNRGRASVHNDAVTLAKGDVLLFTDAATVFEPNFLRSIIPYLDNQEYGCGAGDLTFHAQAAVGQAEGFYWAVEKRLRQMEFELGILPFASGACFLVRRSLYRPLVPYADIDNILPLAVIAEGKKVFYAAEARAYDDAVKDAGSHFRKRVRTAQRSMGDILSMLPELLRAKRYSVICVLFSHRLFRWWSGIVAVILYAVNVALVVDSWGRTPLPYIASLSAQSACYAASLLGWRLQRRDGKGVVQRVSTACYSFVLANLAFSVATFRLLAGGRIEAYRT